jgi:LysM repeat protein
MKIPKFIPRKKPQKFYATARRVSRAQPVEEEEEPNIKLSSAIVVVLLLHVVFVGGIYAFNSIQARRQHESAGHRSETAPVRQPEIAPVAMAEVAPDPAKTAHEPAPAVKPAAATSVRTEPFHPTANEPAKPKHGVKDSGDIYVVAKGDNPVAIARKLKVSYEDLLRLNKIDDPKKLQIGQKLHVPARK